MTKSRRMSLPWSLYFIVSLSNYNAVKTMRSVVTNQLQNGYNWGILIRG
jgi:hypothetical protein